MNISSILITSTFLTNFLPQFLISDHHRRLVILYENQTEFLIDMTLKILSTDTNYKSSWYIRNVDQIINYENNAIPHQGIFLIIAIKSIAMTSQWIINLNKTILFHPRCHTLIISDNKSSPVTNESLTNAINALWNISIINVGILFLSNERNEIMTFNPYAEKNQLINVFSSNVSNISAPAHIHKHVFYEKLTNLNGANFPIMIGLDWGKVYKKTNPKLASNSSYNLGGSEVYTMNIIGKRINASVIYNLQLITMQPNSTDIELFEYLDTINRPVYLSYDQSEPVQIIPKIYGQMENK